MACYQFKDNGNCRFGENCRFSHEEDAMEGGEEPRFRSRAPPRRSRGVCFKFNEPTGCPFGEGCRFSHGQDAPAADFGGGGYDYRPRRPKAGGICFNFRDSGSCQYGDECRFSHDPNAPQPVKSSPGICYKFRDEGNCPFGENCRFSHAAEAPAEEVVPGFGDMSLQAAPEEVAQE